MLEIAMDKYKVTPIAIHMVKESPTSITILTQKDIPMNTITITIKKTITKMNIITNTPTDKARSLPNTVPATVIRDRLVS